MASIKQEEPGRFSAQTKGHLINVVALRQRISALNPSEAQRKAIETDLRDIRQRLQYLLAVSPAIIYTTKASGDYACTFVSENLRAIMGYSPQEMTTDPKCWPDHLHPEDAPRVFERLPPLIERGGGSIEYRFRKRDRYYNWIKDSFKVVCDEAGHPLDLVGAWADITEHKRVEQRLHYLLAVIPAFIYSSKASGDYACTLVIPTRRSFVVYSPEEMTTDPKSWPDHLHPEDAPRVFEKLPPLIERGGGSI